MVRAVLAVPFLMAIGCATAEKQDLGGRGTDAGTGITHVDSNLPPLDSYIPPDAPPGVREKTLTQTASDTITPGNSIACAPTATSGNVGTENNSYYRVFDLTALGITGAFTTETVTFQVEDDESSAGNGTKVDVKVGVYTGATGTTLPGTITPMASVTGVQVPEVDEVFPASGPPTTPGATINVPIAATIPAGGQLIVQVTSAGKVNPGTHVVDAEAFYIATNTGAETGKGYVSSTQCTPPGTTPTSIVSLAAGVSILLTVTGSY